MSLLNTEKTNANTAAFEADEDGVVAAPAVAAEPVAAAPAPAQAPAPVPTVQKGGALAAATGLVDVAGKFKNVLKVEYNTLEQVIPQQGNFVCRESKKVLGDQIDFELLSFQDSWVVSPEDDKAPKDIVRYSDDAITCSDGTPVEEHLHFLKTSGYPKARIKQRVVVVGAILATSKKVDMEGVLVQLDLSPANKTQWMRHTANLAFQVKIGKYTEDQAAKVRANAELATNPNNQTYTLAKFSVAV